MTRQPLVRERRPLAKDRQPFVANAGEVPCLCVPSCLPCANYDLQPNTLAVDVDLWSLATCGDLCDPDVPNPAGPGTLTKAEHPTTPGLFGWLATENLCVTGPPFGGGVDIEAFIHCQESVFYDGNFINRWIFVSTCRAPGAAPGTNLCGAPIQDIWRGHKIGNTHEGPTGVYTLIPDGLSCVVGVATVTVS